MGLDTVELAVEEEFGLEMPDAAAEKMLTIGEMHAFLAGELRRLGHVALRPVIIGPVMVELRI